MNDVVAILKPDAFQRRLWGTCMKFLQDADFEIRQAYTALKVVDELKAHYAEHEGKYFYPKLMDFMQTGPLFVILGRVPSVDVIRQKVFTFRREWQTDGPANLIHCSDSVEAGQREKGIWFPWMLDV